jgi:hypothetical protein
VPDAPETRSAIARNYRGMSIAITAGSLALGALFVDRLAYAVREPIATFYGVGTESLDSLGPVDGRTGHDFSIGALTAAALALVGAIAFVALERRRLRRVRTADRRIARENRLTAIDRLRVREWISQLAARSSVYSAVLMGCYVLDVSLERGAAGLGYGLQFDDWRAALPLASMYGLCVIGGLVTGAISMFGLRVLTSLERLTVEVAGTAWRRVVVVSRPDLRTPVLRFHELLGTTLLSRPPPGRSLV